MNCSTTDAVWDSKLALGRLGGDRELLAEMAAIFIETLSGQLGELRNALAARDAPKLRLLAHSMKGCVSTFAAEAARQAALALEECARIGDFDSAPTALAQLQDRLGELQQALTHYSNG